MSSHLRTIIVDYLYYHGVYCESLGRNNAERLVAFMSLKEWPEFPIDQEHEEAITKREASQGLAIRKPAQSGPTASKAAQPGKPARLAASKPAQLAAPNDSDHVLV
ncbi:hypothetical protein F5Y00DRAFT_265696 [Daldinia vernicosa]|uniref:uncharacterized protein n=1 Tax=Daldinia vernicosa TaxID=114800 RepID=UPI0020078D73|nr:uncharacterized protein F5Y00DRAFT_265696 [Daldinia vernicosa]KAI0845292.1 hypothetical protein F5Y00DRAFT_265696 [Daldinia vernicosa]